MKKFSSLLLAAALCGCFTGCTTFKGNKSVPISKYKDPDRSFEIGKDMHFRKFDMHKGFVDKNGVTNFTHITIDGLESTNSPAVIDSAGVANANSILAGGQVFKQGFEAGGNFVAQLAALFGQSQGLNTHFNPQPAQPPLAQPKVKWPDQLGAIVKVGGKDYKLSETGDHPLGKVRIFVDENGQRFIPLPDGTLVSLTSNTE